MSKFNLPPEPNSGSKRIDANLPLPTIPTAKKAFVVAASGFIQGLKQGLILANEPPPYPNPDPIIGTSVLGTPIYGEIILKDTKEKIIDPSDSSGQGWARFQNCATTVNLPRNIVRTAISGRNGTIKEYISNDDYHIEIIGELVFPAPDVAPHADIRNINDLISLPNEIVIVSDFISSFGVTDCVIEDANFRQIRGYRNVIEFVMRLISDDPIEIQLGITNN